MMMFDRIRRWVLLCRRPNSFYCPRPLHIVAVVLPQLYFPALVSQLALGVRTTICNRISQPHRTRVHISSTPFIHISSAPFSSPLLGLLLGPPRLYAICRWQAPDWGRPRGKAGEEVLHTLVAFYR
jgi:hypothetical protein